MGALHDRVRREFEARQRALRERYAVVKPKPAATIERSRNALIYGVDANNQVFAVTDESRFLHTHVIGVPGSGKSNAITHAVQQDIINGAGVLVPDPHGSHPSSVINKIVQWLATNRVLSARVVHLFDPAADYILGFNPLHCPAGTDPTVIAGHMVEAVERGWGDEDSQERPTMRRGLRAVFTALAELGLTLVEAPYFLLPGDPYGARAWALVRLKNETARRFVERLQMLDADPRMRSVFDIETIGILNRIEEFTSSRAMRGVLGQRTGIDLAEAMDQSHIVLVNLAGGSKVYEKEGDLFGRLFLRATLFHAKRRTNKRPFHVHAEEGHRYVSGDIPILSLKRYVSMP